MSKPMAKLKKGGEMGLTSQELNELRADGASAKLSEKALRSAVQNFQTLDRDKDGHLSVEEFRSGLGMLGMDSTFSTILFNAFDSGGDGRIDVREFVAAMAVMLHPDNMEDQIDLAFDAYDINKDGKLTFDELRQVIASIYATMEQMGINDAQHDPEAVANGLFQQMDRGAKGHVTKEDYLYLARTQPELIKQVGLGGTGMQRRRSRRASSFVNAPPKQKSRRTAGPKKRGTTVSFGHEKWELVVQMMLGIRLAVGRAQEAATAVAGEAGLCRQSSEASDSGAATPVSAQASGTSPAPAAAKNGAQGAGRTAHVTIDVGAAAGQPENQSGTSKQHGEGNDSARLKALRAMASRQRFDRSEPFTILLTKPTKASMLGVVLSSPDDNGLVLVHDLLPGSIALQSGKLRVGDVLVAVDGVEVREHAVASAALRAAEGEVTLKISGKIDADRLCDEVTKFSIPSHHRGKDRQIEFKDYAPQVYRRIRTLFGVSERDYMLSLGPEQIMGELLLGTMGSLSELMSEGKSGSFFYYSNDALYMIKKIPQREMSSLRRLLSHYIRHVEKCPHTLLPRFMGAHRLIIPEIGKVHFVVFSNVFSTDRAIHERYDLKGSTLGRTVGEKELAQKSDCVRKDLDLKRKFWLGGKRDALLKQLRADLAFLREVQTMDYSLLCGIHYPRRDTACAAADDPKASAGNLAVQLPLSGSPAVPPPPEGAYELLPTRSASAPVDGTNGAEGGSTVNGLSGVVRDSSAGEVLPLRSNTVTGSLSLGGPVKSQRAPWEDWQDGAIEGKPSDDGAEPEMYFIGIIDILTAWSPAKSMENLAKTVIHPGERKGISCVPPDAYADRFEKAMVTWIG